MDTNLHLVRRAAHDHALTVGAWQIIEAESQRRRRNATRASVASVACFAAFVALVWRLVA